MTEIGMKKFIILVAFYLAMCSFMFAQSPRAELDKARTIKLLESTSEDIKRLFGESEDADYDSISTEALDIDITYSTGDCSGEYEEWNVPEGKVTEIDVSFGKPVKPQDLGIDLSKFENIGESVLKSFANIYYDKAKGIIYIFSKGGITDIDFVPAAENYPALCNNENVRQFNSDKEWFQDKSERWFITRLKERSSGGGERVFANVNELTLNRNDVTECPAVASSKNGKDCSEDTKIAVYSKASSSDSMEDLFYNYSVSGGRIIGQGANVFWDLSGVAPGKYTITVGVDNGCGVCGSTKTQEIIVKELPKRSQK